MSVAGVEEENTANICDGQEVRTRIQNEIGMHDDLLTIMKKRKCRWYIHATLKKIISDKPEEQSVCCVRHMMPFSTEYFL